MIEKIVISANPDYPLEGLLTIPDAHTKRVPAVLFVHGSGALDKDETIGVNKVFLDLANGLSERGIASLRYDKRTYTYGKQLLQELGGSLSVEEEIIQDALAAANTLKSDHRVNPNRVIILGHSQGGMLASRIDAEGGDFAGLIVLAGTMRALDEVILDQNADVLKQLDETQREAAIPQIHALKKMFDAIDAMTEEIAKQTIIIPQSHVYAWYIKEMRQHPVRKYLTPLQKPVFVLQGDKDVQVSVEKDFYEFEAVLKNCPRATCKLYPDLNHLFMKAIYGTINQVLEEYKVPQTVNHDVIADIAEWVLSI